MEESSVALRECNEADFQKIFPLFAQAYQFNPRLQERDYCEWQFKNTPFSKNREYSLLVSTEGEHITGFLGYLPVEFRLGDQIRTGCISYNWYAAGQNRSGIKLLTELMGRYDNIFYFGCTTESEAIFNMFRMPMSFLSRWIGIINPSRVKEIFQIKDAQEQRKILASSEDLSSLKGSSGGIHSCQRFEDDEEFFFNEWATIKGYIRRTGRYLNWRYVDIPRHNYQLLRDNKGQFAVYRFEQIKNHEEKVVRIVEWNFKGQDAQNALAFITNQAREQNAILIDFISSTGEIGEHLQSLGFFKASHSSEGIPYLFRPIYHTRDILIAVDLPPHRIQRQFDFNEWYITKGDSDMDRIKL